MTTLESLLEAPPLSGYLEQVEETIEATVRAYPGLVADVGAYAMVGGKRLRPLLTFLAAPLGTTPSVAAGAAVELVHMATLVHDDLVDQASLRHGRAPVWSVHGELAAVATGDYLFARAFAVLAATGDVEAVRILAEAAVALSRGEALQQRQAHDPDTTVESYLARCSLKTGKLFEAACLLVGGPGDFGRALGLAYQITDDILDCTGDTADTGKVPGTDLREGTPTLPLLLAARRDDVVRRALAGEGPLDGALVRVAATGALERSRDVARRYAAEARNALDPTRYPRELALLADAAVDRRG
jgi:geranylgeranyl pyrophosphate synthase